MNNGWELKKLGDLFDITSSKRVFRSDWKSEGVPFYRAREIVKLAQQGFVENQLFISEEMFKSYSAKYGVPTAGDIMVTGVGTLGICFVVRERDRFYFKDGNIIWLKSKGEVNSRFIEYAFKSDFLRAQIDDSVGATVGTYTIVKAKNTLVPVPPALEQQRIVAALDEAFATIAAARANTEQNLDNATSLFDSYLDEMFAGRGEGWPASYLGELCEVLDSRRIPITKRDRIAGTVPYYGATGIQDHVQGFIFDEPLVLVGEDGAKWGAGEATAFAVSQKSWVNNHAHVLRPNRSTLLDRWLVYFLNRSDLSRFVSGLTVPKLNQANLRRIPVPLPPMSVQNDLTTKAREIETDTRRLAAIFQQKLTMLDALKESLLDRALTGAI